MRCGVVMTGFCPTPLFENSLLVCVEDDTIVLQTLMPYCEGDSLEIYDAYGMTPLSASINCANFDAVKMLLEHSSQVNCDQLGGYGLLRSAAYTNSTGEFSSFSTSLIPGGT
jgi:hypothetical protein